MTSLAEENYLKEIYKLHEKSGTMVTTSALAESLQINAASVTDFIKKMAAKKLITYQKSKGVSLTETGRQVAVNIIRKHRLWEVWLVNNLGFKWDEVHEIAEQLGHSDLVLGLSQEVLLPGAADDVAVFVSKAHIVERFRAAHLLIARLDVDRRVPRANRQVAVVVEVATINVNVNAANAVDRLAEAAEVDVHHMVDLQPCVFGDRLQRKFGAAEGV